MEVERVLEAKEALIRVCADAYLAGWQTVPAEGPEHQAALAELARQEADPRERARVAALRAKERPRGERLAAMLQARKQRLAGSDSGSDGDEAADGDGAGEYVAREILYFVKWRGLGYADCTWERRKDINDDARIREFYRVNKIPPRRLLRRNRVIPSKVNRGKTCVCQQQRWLQWVAVRARKPTPCR